MKDRHSIVSSLVDGFSVIFTEDGSHDLHRPLMDRQSLRILTSFAKSDSKIPERHSSIRLHIDSLAQNLDHFLKEIFGIVESERGE